MSASVCCIFTRRHPQLTWLLVCIACFSSMYSFGQDGALVSSDPYRLNFDDLEWQEPLELCPIEEARPMRLSSDTAAAIEMFERRVAELSGDFANRTILGQLLLQHAKETDELPAYNRSERILRKAIENNPEYLPAKLALAHTLSARHGFREALQLAQEVDAAIPNKPSTLAVLFDCQLELGELVVAAETLTRLQDLENSAPVLARAARLRELEGDREKAISLVRSAIVDLETTADVAPDEMAWYLWRLGSLQFDAGRIGEARSTFSEGLKLEAEDEALLVGLAMTQFASGDIQATIASLEKAAVGEAPPVLSLLGDAFRLIGDEGKAQALWQRTDAIMQEEAKVAKVAHSREVAMFYADHNLKPEQAVQLSELDLSQRAGPQSWDCHAWTLFKNGKTEDARKSIRKALMLAKDDCNLLYHAAAIECSAGNLVLAKQYIERIESINPHFSITYNTDFRSLRKQLEPLQ